MKVWPTVKALGIGAAGVAAFVLTIVSIMGGLKDLRKPQGAASLHPPLVSDRNYESCRELPKSQGDRILGMVADGKLTSEQAGELARSLACGAYRRSEQQSQVANANYARRMEVALIFLMTSRDAKIRTETANAIRSDFNHAALERLFEAATPEPERERGLGPDLSHDATPGQVHAAAVSAQTIIDELRATIEAMRSDAPTAH